MNLKIFTCGKSALLFAGTCLLVTFALICTTAKSEDKSTEGKSLDAISIKGTCMFMNQQGTWSAKLTPTSAPDIYDAKYVAAFAMGGNNMTYVGQVKSDFKTAISGGGKSTGGGGNGNFEFSGKYGDDGIAKCNYMEVGGQRTGTLTAGKPE
jgi:hypothetical protein